jgi:hemoglobin-like flavoprotein
MYEQRKLLEAALVTVIENLHAPARLREPLLKLGGRHASFGVLPEQYAIFRDTLVGVIAESYAKDWNEQLDADWHAALDHVSEVLLEGQKLGAASMPDDGA